MALLTNRTQAVFDLSQIHRGDCIRVRRTETALLRRRLPINCGCFTATRRITRLVILTFLQQTRQSGFGRSIGRLISRRSTMRTTLPVQAHEHRNPAAYLRANNFRYANGGNAGSLSRFASILLPEITQRQPSGLGDAPISARGFQY